MSLFTPLFFRPLWLKLRKYSSRLLITRNVRNQQNARCMQTCTVSRLWQSMREPITEPRPDPQNGLPMMCSTGSCSHRQWPYYLLSLYDKPIYLIWYGNVPVCHSLLTILLMVGGAGHPGCHLAGTSGRTFRSGLGLNDKMRAIYDPSCIVCEPFY